MWQLSFSNLAIEQARRHYMVDRQAEFMIMVNNGLLLSARPTVLFA